MLLIKFNLLNFLFVLFEMHAKNVLLFFLLISN